MKRVLFIILLAGAGAGCWAQEAARERQPIPVDGVAAYVNDSVITFSEVMIEVNRIKTEYMPDSELLQWKKERYKEFLNVMIDRRLIMDYAKKTKVQLQPWAVDARVREIVSNGFDGDSTKLYDLLAERKVSIEEWKKGLEEELLLTAMRYQYVEKRVQVTPSEIRVEYEANKSRYQTATAVAVSMIVLAPPGDATEATVAERADRIYSSLKEGASFADLARKYSKDAKAENGGSWGKINPEEVFFSELADVVAKLRPGELAPLVMLKEDGFIVRKDEQQDMRTLTFDEAAQYVEGRLRIEKSEKMFKEWVGRLRSEAYIKILEVTGEK